jgi:hypothetical protein
MLGSSGFHHYRSPAPRTPQDEARLALKMKEEAEDAYQANALRETISALPEGKQTLVLSLLARALSAHTSRRTKDAALAQLALELGTPIRSGTARLLWESYPEPARYAAEIPIIRASELGVVVE